MSRNDLQMRIGYPKKSYKLTNGSTSNETFMSRGLNWMCLQVCDWSQNWKLLMTVNTSKLRLTFWKMQSFIRLLFGYEKALALSLLSPESRQVTTAGPGCPHLVTTFQSRAGTSNNAVEGHFELTLWRRQMRENIFCCCRLIIIYFSDKFLSTYY